MTEGFDVLVHEVMAAMTTCPWSIVTVVPSSSATGHFRVGRNGLVSCTIGGSLVSSFASATVAGGSDAGNDSADASSAEPGAACGSGSDVSSVVQNISFDDFRGMLS